MDDYIRKEKRIAIKLMKVMSLAIIRLRLGKEITIEV